MAEVRISRYGFGSSFQGYRARMPRFGVSFAVVFFFEPAFVRAPRFCFVAMILVQGLGPGAAVGQPRPELVIGECIELSARVEHGFRTQRTRARSVTHHLSEE